MNHPLSADPRLAFILPDPLVHAPVTLRWFQTDYGKETLLLMGNAETEIGIPSLENEREILSDFVALRAKHEQLTWMLSWEGVVIGVGWIELVENHNVHPPSVHLMIGDKSYRGRGIGKKAMSAMITFMKHTLDSPAMYSRHLSSNIPVKKMTDSLGFKQDGASYVDEDGLEWQNIKLVF